MSEMNNSDKNFEKPNEAEEKKNKSKKDKRRAFFIFRAFRWLGSQLSEGFTSLWCFFRELCFKIRGKRDSIYYVNGADILPAPLGAEEESEMISKLYEDENARQILIEHNLRLVVYIAKRFENTGAGLEDLVSIGTIGLIKAINTFRADKNIKLATYASRCIENEILMYIRKHSGSRAEVSIDEPLNTDWDGNELLLSDILGSEEDSVLGEIEKEEERAIIRRAVASLDEREREIIELRYGLCGGKELTQKEVADKLGISQSYISRLEKKIISHLKTEIQSVF